MTKHHNHWLNADKFDSLHPNFEKGGTYVISESDYDKISAPVFQILSVSMSLHQKKCLQGTPT